MADRKSFLSKAWSIVHNSRYASAWMLIWIYMALCFVIRLTFIVWSANDAQLSVLNFIRAFATGFVFDFTVGLSFLFIYFLYLLFFPKKWIGSVVDKVITYSYFSLILFIIYFSLIAEIPFWEEFGIRFNFIAVDYLIYTYEVVANINQSYPLPLIIAFLLMLIVLTFFILKKTGSLKQTFSEHDSFVKRLTTGIIPIVITPIFLFYLNNKQAEFTENAVMNEVSKNGVFSFFAAFRSNELDYDAFYPKLSQSEAYSVLKKDLLQDNQQYIRSGEEDIIRKTVGSEELRPNIVMVVIESLSAEFLGSFGNSANLTPNYDSLAKQSIFFTNLYATGTRTVRGMEALTLCVPPTPGNSIVRRPNNQKLFSIATILKQRNYQPYFIYGGDGYFDNMNNFFGGQGFTIVDRNRGNPLSDNIETQRFNIAENDIHFENAWGVCDEDIYRQALKHGDISYKANRPFFQFIMTTSNHKPYTFPEGTIDLPQGERNSAVKYTDYALGQLIQQARTKPWFNNTIFVVVADHCASSAGKWEINIDKHHIPAIFYNLKQPHQTIDRLTSQIDLLPTLFGYLNWNYDTELYGKDINKTKEGDERAFIGNYRTLGMLKGKVFTQIDDRKRVVQFDVIDRKGTMNVSSNKDKKLTDQTISYYQTASERFKNGKMKEQGERPQN
jgi:phosphoglycerol transferase MdoB-like AlkP superfamily enzyme